MPKYILNRNHLHRSVWGHSIAFVKGEPVYVPPGPIELEVAAIGAERVDGDQPDLVPAEQVEKEEMSLEDLEVLMRSAFEELIAKNDPTDFTGAGIPTVKAMEKIVGENMTARQIADLWQRVKQEKAE